MLYEKGDDELQFIAPFFSVGLADCGWRLFATSFCRNYMAFLPVTGRSPAGVLMLPAKAPSVMVALIGTGPC